MEKSDVQRRRSSPVKQRRWLGTKRSHSELKENYLCKRLAHDKIETRYGNLANTFYNMMAFDWEEEKIGKLRTNIMSNLSAMSYWFYLCSNYFPYESNQFLGNEDEVFEWLNVRVLNTLVENKRQVKKKSQTRRKYSFFKDLKAVIEHEESCDEQKIEVDDEVNEMEEEEKIMPQDASNANEDVEMNEEKLVTDFKKFSIDKVISIFEEKVELVSDKKDKFFEFLISKMKSQKRSLCSLDRSYINDPDDILIDMKFKNPFAKKFVNYLISKHEKEKGCEENTASSNIAKLEKSENFETMEKVSSLNDISSISHNVKNTHLKSSLIATTPKIILSRTEEEDQSNPDDVVCLVCNDGDYEDNDLIVYCSKCQMTVHQTCYGIVNIPEDDWICYPCLAFKEKSREVKCLVCPVKGGAMKPCNLKLNSAVFKYITNLRKSPPPKNKSSNICSLDIQKIKYKLNDYSKQILEKNIVKICITPNENNLNFPKYSTNQPLSKKEEENLNVTEDEESKSVLTSRSIVTITDDSQRMELLLKREEAEAGDKSENAEVETNKQTITSSNCDKKRGRRKKQKKKKTPNKSDIKNPETTNEFFNPKIIRENCWIHLSCATWLKDFVIYDYERKQDIRDFLDKARFTEHCSVCNLKNYGPTVKCGNENCKLQFHVECARINKYLLEHSVDDQNIAKFYIYCQTHRPHRLVKNTEISRKRTVEDIDAFADILNKNYDLMSKLQKSVDFSIHIPKKYNNPNPERKKLHLFTTSIAKNDKFKRLKIKETEAYDTTPTISNKDRSRIIHRIREILLLISNMNISITSNDEECKIVEPSSKPKITISYQESLNPEIFPWYMLKGTCKLLPSIIFNYYSRDLVPNIETYNRLILQKSAGFKVKSKKKKFSRQNNPIEKALPSPYCYCKTDTDLKGDFVECYYGVENDNNRTNSDQACVHNGWVHKLCVPSLAALDDDYLHSEEFVFACKECIEKFGEPPLNIKQTETETEN